jgi:hypothetical protein
MAMLDFLLALALVDAAIVVGVVLFVLWSGLLGRDRRERP